MGNCDIWFYVDFGKGPVLVRCTETDEHERHRCEVFCPLPDDKTKSVGTLVDRNVFERDDK